MIYFFPENLQYFSPFPLQKGSPRQRKLSATGVLFPCWWETPAKAGTASLHSIIVDLLACALEGLQPLRDVTLPSQFPNGRLTARVMHSCTYSNA